MTLTPKDFVTKKDIDNIYELGLPEDLFLIDPSKVADELFNIAHESFSRNEIVNKLEDLIKTLRGEK